MAKKLYVGNLTDETTESDLREMFAQFGSIASIALIKDGDTGISRGFAFVEMKTQEGADQARQKLTGTMLNDRPLRIDEARPLDDRGAGGSRSSSSSGRGGFSGGNGGRSYGGGSGYSGKGGNKKRGGGSATDHGGW